MSTNSNPGQCERLLAWLRNRGPISPFEAWRELGIYRLAARIHDLRQAGHQIETGSTDVVTSFKEVISVAEYRLTS